MSRRLVMFTLCVLSCDSFLINNPQNCERTANACSSDEYCDPVSKTCRTRDCLINTGLCTSAEYCSPETRRCAAKDCPLDPSLCAADQRCNLTSRTCETLRFVLGQPDEVTNLGLAYGMNRPEMVRLIPDPSDASRAKLLVGDVGNRRVLIWNTLPTSNRPADAVLGVPNVHTLAANGPYGGVNESSIGASWGMSSDGVQVVVGDLQLNRTLFWNAIPSQPPARGPIPANRVWGQSSFLNNFPDGGAPDPTPLGIRAPKVFLDRTPSTAFYLSDTNNHRVLYFPTAPGGPSVAPAAILGQPSGTAVLPNTAANGLRLPRDVTSDGVYAWVADGGNHRVLGFDLATLATGVAATAVLGQADFVSAVAGGLTQRLRTPTSVTAHKATRQVWVADGGNHRVLRFSAPSGVNQAADLVLGQADFTGGAVNRGGPPAANTVATPAGLDTDGTRLAVGDYGNNRVLLWLSLPTSNGQPADVILGQPTANSLGVNALPSHGPLLFNAPRGVASDGTRLVISDGGNHRVLIWNQLPRSGNTPPDVVLGQADFQGDLPNGGGPVSASGISTPTGVAIENGRLAVGDLGNSRVLIWNQIPTQNNQPADLCLGQVSCATAAAGTSPSQLRNVYGVTFSSGGLYVADVNNHRVVVFDAPLAQGQAASRVLGQPNLGAGGLNTGGLSASTLNQPRSLHIDGGRLLVADTGNHRVLLWNTLPTRDGQPADVVIGQSDFSSAYTRPDRAMVESPFDAVISAGHLYVACSAQSRILYWSKIPTKNGEPADRVLGQPDFVSALPNHPDLPPVERLTTPVGLLPSGNQLMIVDSSYNRVAVRDAIR